MGLSRVEDLRLGWKVDSTSPHGPTAPLWGAAPPGRPALVPRATLIQGLSPEPSRGTVAGGQEWQGRRGTLHSLVLAHLSSPLIFAGAILGPHRFKGLPLSLLPPQAISSQGY